MKGLVSEPLKIKDAVRSSIVTFLYIISLQNEKRSTPLENLASPHIKSKKNCEDELV